MNGLNYGVDPNYGLQTPMGNWGMPQQVAGGGLGFNSGGVDLYAPSPIPGVTNGVGFTGSLPNTLGGAAPATGGGDFWGGMLGTKEAPGWGGMALGAASGLANAFMGMKQYGLAKDTLAESKKQFNLNYDAQKRTTNSALEDRQRARTSSNPGAYQSVGDYMTKHGIQ